MSLQYKKTDDLINDLRKGNQNAYIYLINNHNKTILNYALSLTNDIHLAKDIVQDVFLDVWKDRKKLKPTSSLKNYLFKIAYHKFINQYHKNRTISALERAYVEALDQTFNDSNSELLEQKIALVFEGISNLPKKCKEIFLLSKKEGLTNIEISEYMNISIKTVEGHLTKAYCLLRERVGDQIKFILLLVFGKKSLTI